MLQTSLAKLSQAKPRALRQVEKEIRKCWVSASDTNRRPRYCCCHHIQVWEKERSYYWLTILWGIAFVKFSDFLFPAGRRDSLTAFASCSQCRPMDGISTIPFPTYPTSPTYLDNRVLGIQFTFSYVSSGSVAEILIWNHVRRSVSVRKSRAEHTDRGAKK